MLFRSQVIVLDKEAGQRAALPLLPAPATFLAPFPVLYQPCAMDFYPRTFAQRGPSAQTSVPHASLDQLLLSP